MQAGDSVVYVALFPVPGRPRYRPGVIRAVCGQSALVLFADSGWVQGVPLERLHLAVPDVGGWGQIKLFGE